MQYAVCGHDDSEDLTPEMTTEITLIAHSKYKKLSVNDVFTVVVKEPNEDGALIHRVTHSAIPVVTFDIKEVSK